MQHQYEITILSAAYVNEDHSAVVIQTAESGAVMISAADTPEWWGQFETWLESNSCDPYQIPQN